MLLECSLADHRRWESQIEEIRAELAALKSHPWAGEYVGRSGRWSITRWLYPPDSHFVRREGPGCVSGTSLALRTADRLYDRGWIEVHGDRIEISRDEYLQESAGKYDDGRYPESVVHHIVPWGERRYLVREEAMKDFWSAAQDGSAPGDRYLEEGVLLRRGDEARPAEGLPTLPADFAHLVR